MNKLILCFLLLSTIPLYAQENSDDTLEVHPHTPSDEFVAPAKPDELTDTSEEKTQEHAKKENRLKSEINLPPTEKGEFVPPITEVEEPAVTEKVELTEKEKEAEAKAAEKAEPVEDQFVPVAKPELIPKTKATYVETEVEQLKEFNPYKSHWLFTFGFEHAKYEVVPEKEFAFEGKKDFKNDFQELWGGRLGFGGEIYLGGGFITRTMAEGYYMGTLFSRVLNGGDEAEDVDFAYTKKTGQILGFDASQSLGWMFDMKTKNPFMDEWSYLTIEPFVEAGIGIGWAYQNINHSYDTTGDSGGVDERYKLTVRDDLVNARIGGGINMTSRKGFFLNMRATVNRFDITKRSIDGFRKQSADTSPTVFDETQKNASIEPVIMYTLGGGYKF